MSETTRVVYRGHRVFGPIPLIDVIEGAWAVSLKHGDELDATDAQLSTWRARGHVFDAAPLPEPTTTTKSTKRSKANG